MNSRQPATSLPVENKCDHDWTTVNRDQGEPPGPFYEGGWVRVCRFCGAADE